MVEQCVLADAHHARLGDGCIGGQEAVVKSEQRVRLDDERPAHVFTELIGAGGGLACGTTVGARQRLSAHLSVQHERQTAVGRSAARDGVSCCERGERELDPAEYPAHLLDCQTLKQRQLQYPLVWRTVHLLPSACCEPCAKIRNPHRMTECRPLLFQVFIKL